MLGTARTRVGRRFRQRLLLLAVLLATGAALPACGQPQGVATAPTGVVVPAGVASSRNSTSTSTPNYTPAPTPGGPRTPPPIPPTARVTVTPAPPIPFDRPTPDPARPPSTPPPTPRPEDPYNLGVAADGALVVTRESTQATAQSATVIALATVKRWLPARWSTPDGGRPANPHDNRDTIYTPILVEVEQYLKGERSDEELVLIKYGGVVGRDSISYSYSFALPPLDEGERVVLFLYEPPARFPRTLDGRTVWKSGLEYTVTEDGRAANPHRTLPFEQLLGEIAAAQRRP